MLPIRKKERESPGYLQGNSPITEAFRTLRTNILYAGNGKQVRTVVVTSSGSQEGKSTIAANLAAVMAMAGSRCILVDADLRRPVQAKRFQVSGRIGLTTLLLGQLHVEDALVPTETPELYLLPSGQIPPNPAELLGSKAMAQLVDKLTQAADVVILDAPPLLPVTDAALLASYAEGTVLVVDSGRTNRKAAIRSKQALESVQARILGVVMNNCDQKQGYKYDYYNYYTR